MHRSLSVQPDHEANANELRFKHYQSFRDNTNNQNRTANSFETSSVSSDEPISSLDSDSVSSNSSGLNSLSDQDQYDDHDDTFSDDEDLTVVIREDNTDGMDEDDPLPHDTKLSNRILQNAENTVTSPPPAILQQIQIQKEKEQKQNAMDIDGGDDHENDTEIADNADPVQVEKEKLDGNEEEKQEQSLVHFHCP